MPRIRLERSPNGDITSRVKTADRNHLMQLSHQRYLAASGLAEQPSTPSWIRVSTLHGNPAAKAFLDALDCPLSPSLAKASQSASGGLTWRRPERDRTMETAPTISSSSPGAVNWPAIGARITS